MLVNLTPHRLVVFGENDGPIIELPPSKAPARVTEGIAPLEGLLVGEVTVPRVSVTMGERVTDLPEPSPGVFYVVSRITAQVLVDRDDLLFPHGDVRDETGRIIGCRALGSIKAQ